MRFSIAPSPSISTRTRSPGTSQRGGFMATATPAGVPVEIRSPGSSVKAVERCSTSAAQSKISCFVFERWRSSPFTRVSSPRLPASISSRVTRAGPNGQWVSKDLPIVMVGVRVCQSRTETSSTTT